MKDFRNIQREIMLAEEHIKNNTFDSFKTDILVENLSIDIFNEMTDEELNTFENYIHETKLVLIKNGMPSENINEGFLGSLIGGAAGYFIGPSIGRVIARVLGIQKGILYDLLTSKLVGTALGVGISKSLSKRKN